MYTVLAYKQYSAVYRIMIAVKQALRQNRDRFKISSLSYCFVIVGRTLLSYEQCSDPLFALHDKSILIEQIYRLSKQSVC